MYSPQLLRIVLAEPVFLLTICIISEVGGELLYGPTDTEAVRGMNISLTCSTSFVPDHYVNWFHVPSGTTTRIEVYYNDLNIRPYFPRFQVSKDTTRGEYNLTISSVDFSDSGTYICVDKSGSGVERRAELVVLASVPNVQANTSLDDLRICNQGVHTIGLTCSLSYKGNIAPILQWEKVTPDGKSSSYLHNDTTSDVSSSMVTSSTAVTVDYTMHLTSFKCHTLTMVRSIPTTLHLKYVVSNANRGKYDNSSFCQVEANVPCQYTFFNLKNKKANMSSENFPSNSSRTLVGFCKFTCNLGEESCEVIEPYYENGDTSTAEYADSLRKQIIVLSIVLGLILSAGVVVAVFVVVVVVARVRKRKSIFPRGEGLKDVNRNESNPQQTVPLNTLQETKTRETFG